MSVTNSARRVTVAADLAKARHRTNHEDNVMVSNAGITRAGQGAGAALILTVITQIVYLGLDAGGQAHIAYPIWRIEAIAALVVAVLGFGLIARNALVGGALAAGGLLNLFQTGMGLTLFYQLGYGGEAPPEPAFMPILGFSFFLYFAAKAAIGIAGLVLGTRLVVREQGLWKWLGLTALITGVAAFLANIAAMAMGMGIVFVAGGIGTVATLFAAIALLRFATSAAD